ncbi:MAG: replication protein RepA [Bryobacterales bacterium]|nr:replication protein RepA [Bryobacterales bacterium]
MTDITLHLTTLLGCEGPAAARGADPDTGFVMRLLMLCALPRTNPRRRAKYVRRHGAYKLVIMPNPDHGLPYGPLPRLILAWMCSEAAWTQARSLAPGRSLHDFMKRIGLPDAGGVPEARRLQNQLDRLCDIMVEISYPDDGEERVVSGLVVDHRELWWNPERPQEPAARENRVLLGSRLYRGALRHPVPVDIRTLRELAHSPLGLDLYSFLACRGFSMAGPRLLTWVQLYELLGDHPAKVADGDVVNSFRTRCLREIRKIQTSWPGLQYRVVRGGLEVGPSEPPVTREEPPWRDPVLPSGSGLPS